VALLPQITLVAEAGGATLLEVTGTYSPPSLNDIVWLGEAGSLIEYKVEKVAHFYTYKDITNPTSGGTEKTLNATITITLSVV